MKVVVIYDLDDAIALALTKQDKRVTEILSDINTQAMIDWPIDIWHFDDRAHSKLQDTLRERYKWMASKITEQLIGRLK